MLQALHLRENEEQLISAVYYASPASYAINAPGLRSIPPERVGLRGEGSALMHGKEENQVRPPQ